MTGAVYFDVSYELLEEWLHIPDGVQIVRVLDCNNHYRTFQIYAEGDGLPGELDKPVFCDVTVTRTPERFDFQFTEAPK